jgi:hypothetical protein
MPIITPDRAALEMAHRKLRSPRPLDEMLQVDSLRKLLESLARRHMKRRAWFDPKKLQANDND